MKQTIETFTNLNNFANEHGINLNYAIDSDRMVTFTINDYVTPAMEWTDYNSVFHMTGIVKAYIKSIIEVELNAIAQKVFLYAAAKGNYEVEASTTNYVLTITVGDDDLATIPHSDVVGSSDEVVTEFCEAFDEYVALKCDCTEPTSDEMESVNEAMDKFFAQLSELVAKDK